MDFQRFVKNKNRELKEYESKLSEYKDFEVKLKASKQNYLKLKPGSAEYLKGQSEYDALLGKSLSVPLPDMYQTNKEIKLKIVLPKKKKIIKKPQTQNTKTLSPKLNTSAKEKLLQAALRTTFKFNTIEECKSQARTKAFYLSKPNLIEAIKNNKILADHVGKMNSTISKEELCNRLFGVKK